MTSSVQEPKTIPFAGKAHPVPVAVAHMASAAQWRLLMAGLVAADISLTALAFILAGWLRYNLSLPFFNLQAEPAIPSPFLIILVLIPLWGLLFALQGLYERHNLLGGLLEYGLVFRAVTIGMLILVIFGFLDPRLNMARGWVLLAWPLATLLVMTGRFFLRRFVYYLRTHGYFLSPSLILGTNSEAALLADELRRWRTSGLAVLGLIATDDASPVPSPGAPVILGDLSRLEAIVATNHVEELILATSAMNQEQILEVFKRYGVDPAVNLRLSSGLFEIINTGLVVKEIASVPLVSVNPVRLAGSDWWLKTILDLVIGLILMAVFLPFILIFAAAVRLTSPGPVFYRRRVMGLNGKQFDAFKFRTMYVNGDEILAAHPELQAELAQTHKLKRDPRVTPIGHFLRKHSLDELPQFFNVLRREMSVVGPRMISPAELAMYEQWDMNLLTVLPGITGLWQVSGRSDIAYAERVQLDMRYIRNWSILLDIHILLRTVQVVIRGEGAY